MRTDKFMIYVFSAIMLGGMVACSSDDPETDTGNGNGNGGNAEAPYVWGAEGAIKTCDHFSMSSFFKLLERNFLRQQIAYSNLYFLITNFFRNT